MEFNIRTLTLGTKLSMAAVSLKDTYMILRYVLAVLLDVLDNKSDLLLFLHHVLYHYLMLFQRLGNLTKKNPL